MRAALSAQLSPWSVKLIIFAPPAAHVYSFSRIDAARTNPSSASRENVRVKHRRLHFFVAFDTDAAAHQLQSRERLTLPDDDGNRILGYIFAK